jgi:hypothetical protein
MLHRAAPLFFEKLSSLLREWHASSRVGDWPGWWPLRSSGLSVPSWPENKGGRRMLRLGSVVLVILLLFAVPVMADELGVVVKYEKGKLTFKTDGKEETVEMKKDRPHLHAADGKRIKMADYAKHLKKGVKLDIERKDGKIVELTLKK